MKQPILLLILILIVIVERLNENDPLIIESPAAINTSARPKTMMSLLFAMRLRPLRKRIPICPIGRP